MNAAARREALLDRLADHVLAEGLQGLSLRPLAKAVGTSDRMLLYYFADKAELVAAVLERIAARLTARLAAGPTPAPMPRVSLQAELAAMLFTDEMWPYMRIWLEVASLAGRGEPLFRQLGEAIGRGFLAWGTAWLDCPDETERAAEAARLMATIEGLLVLKSVGLDDVARLAVSPLTPPCS